MTELVISFRKVELTDTCLVEHIQFFAFRVLFLWIANLRQSCGELSDGSLPGISIIKIDMASFFRFKAKAMYISGLLKDRRRTPLQETCDWIEYVLRHGGARHLRPQVFNIPWYQYYLLDVMAFLAAIIVLVGMVIMLICRCLCRLCCKKSENKPKKE